MIGLVFEETIIHVHYDLDPWAVMSVGLNDNRQLVVEMTYDRMESDSPRLRYDKRIIVSQVGTDKLIDCLHTTLTRLPVAFADEFGTSGESWSVSEVFDIFNEILNYLSCLKIHFEIVKTLED